MNKRFRVCDLDQQYLLPPSLQDWLPENHLARFIAEVTNELDLSAIYKEFERKDARGLSAYHPLLLTRLLLYGYCSGVTSSRRIEKACSDEVAFRYLAANQHPDHDTVANFRREHLDALAGLFVQALQLCQKAGLVKLGNVAIDGTKIMANASTRRSVPYKKLSERERYWKETVDRLLAEAQRTDQEEDQRWSNSQSNDLPPELARAKDRLERLRQAKAELEREAQQQLEAALNIYTPGKRGGRSKQAAPQQPSDPQARQKAKMQLRRARENAAHPHRQYNFVDPDSRVMMDTARKSFTQAYNAQIAVDAEAQVIVAAELTQETTDRRQLLPMVEAVRKVAGDSPETVTADAGYGIPSACAMPRSETFRCWFRQTPNLSCRMPNFHPRWRTTKKLARCGNYWRARWESGSMQCARLSSNLSSGRSKKPAVFADSDCAASSASAANGS